MVSHHITVFFLLLSILPLFSVCLLLYSYICVQDAMTLMRLKIQTRKLIKTSTVYLYMKRANYSYAGLNCFYCSHMHDRVYCNRAMGAQWLSGRVLDSRPKGSGFEPHRRHCIVVLEQDTFILA